jgi:hypothetical protein
VVRSFWWYAFRAFIVVLLSVWLVIGNVLAVEATCSAPHCTVFGRAGLLSLLALADCGAVAFIVQCPLAELMERMGLRG